MSSNQYKTLISQDMTKKDLIKLIERLDARLKYSQNELKRLRFSRTKRTIKPNDLYSTCEKVANETFNTQINQKSRLKECVNGRMFYYAYLRENTKLSLQGMANTLKCGHDHATVLNALWKHEDYVEIDKTYAKDYKEYCEKVQSLLNNSHLSYLEDVINPS